MKKQIDAKRKALQIEAVVSDGWFEYKGIKYKSPSLRTVRMLEMMENVLPSSTEMDVIIRTLFVLSKDYPEFKKALETLEESLLDYSETFVADDLQQISGLLNHQNDLITSVDYNTESDTKK